MSTVIFLSLRVLHVLLAAVWVGATVFITFLLMPVVDKAGPSGAQIMMGLQKRGIAAFFGAAGGLTALTGIYLYWRFTGGFDPAISRSHAGMAFGIGGVSGLLATIVGGAVVGRSAAKLTEVMGEAAKLPDGAQKGALMQTAGLLRQRVSTFGTLVLVLQVIALVLMALGHYI